jgi:two-component system, OmpR family, response regulator
MDRILLVEDNKRLAEELKISLELAGFELQVGTTLAEATRLHAKGGFQMILLDADGSGFDWCKEIRAKDPATPVVFLTAKVDEESVVQGLALGVSDYLRKPFSTRELIARMRAHLSRSGKAGKQVAYAGVVIDMAEKRAQYAGQEISLTRREFQVMEQLVRRGGNVMTREQCLAELDSDGEILDRTLDSTISRLRKKLKTAGAKDLDIESSYGEGYRLLKK